MKSFLCDKIPFFKSAFTLGFREALERENMTGEDPIAFCQCNFMLLLPLGMDSGSGKALCTMIGLQQAGKQVGMIFRTLLQDIGHWVLSF
jgi:hypothetical protein